MSRIQTSPAGNLKNGSKRLSAANPEEVRPASDPAYVLYITTPSHVRNIYTEIQDRHCWSSSRRFEQENGGSREEMFHSQMRIVSDSKS